MNNPNLSQNQPDHKPITCAEIVAQFETMRDTLIAVNASGMWSVLGNIRLEVALIITPSYMPNYWYYIYDDKDFDVYVDGEWHEIYRHFQPVLEVS